MNGPQRSRAVATPGCPKSATTCSGVMPGVSWRRTVSWVGKPARADEHASKIAQQIRSSFIARRCSVAAHDDASYGRECLFELDARPVEEARDYLNLISKQWDEALVGAEEVCRVRSGKDGDAAPWLQRSRLLIRRRVHRAH